uniref:Myosin tail domain-containing protein n=1 Tax=Hucho hucho TaxID=62062 RepID=A0A4W5PGR7_9TELE
MIHVTVFRDKLCIQASQRRVERKLKDIIVTLDPESNQHAKQDQLSLRVKALKRQLDESEGEVERLEGVRRKALRDLEEQQELHCWPKSQHWSLRSGRCIRCVDPSWAPPTSAPRTRMVSMTTASPLS